MNGDDLFECTCSSDATHQLGVVMHDRDHEDGTPETRCLWSALGLEVAAQVFADVDALAARVDSIPFQCSARRDCLHVIVLCEECSRLSAVDYCQHKGGTYVTTSVERDLAAALELRGPWGGGEA